MKVLCVDDAASTRFMIECIVEDMGMSSVSASAGQEAIDLVTADLPDIVLMDVNMPGINGYEAAKKVKNIASGHHLPIIFITGSTDDAILTKCVDIGDDYIAKPINADVITAKIKAHVRVVELYRNLEAKNKTLFHYQKHAEDERGMVQSIFDHFYHDQWTDSKRLRRYISPKSLFSGDVLLTLQSPSEGVYIMIGDVTGHGLPAAVAAIPVYSAFKAMASKGVCIGVMAAELNRVLHHLLPAHIMLAATLLEVNSTGTRVTAWSGGMPAGIISDKDGNIVDYVESMHAPLSVLEDHEFCQDVKLFKLTSGDKIYLHTDGIIESSNSAGVMYGEDRLTALFNGDGANNMFERILADVEVYRGGVEQDDDTSLLELKMPVLDADGQPVITRESNKEVAAIPWHLHSVLQVEDLQNTEPVTQLLKLLGQAVGLDVHQDYLSTILSEMFNNALEHGLLALDSNIKSAADGYYDYYRLRTQRLAQMTQGSIEIVLDFHPSNKTVSIQVSHDRLGFDCTKLNVALTGNESSFGRGLSIIHSLCESFEYSNGGRSAKAVYLLS